MRESDVHGERHGDADADGGALERADGGFAAVVDGEGDAAASVHTHFALASLLFFLLLMGARIAAVIAT